MSNTDPVSATISTYDERAAFFVARGKADMTRHFDQFTRMLPQRGRVLDVGCGPGWHSVELARRGFRVISLDLSCGMLNEAQKLGARELALADMRRLPIANETVDGLWVSASFLHVPRAAADATLREFQCVLKTGGAMHIGVKGGEGERFASPLDGLPRYFIYWTEGALDAKLHDAGFEIVAGWTDAPEAKQTHADPWINRFVVKLEFSR